MNNLSDHIDQNINLTEIYSVLLDIVHLTPRFHYPHQYNFPQNK